MCSVAELSAALLSSCDAAGMRAISKTLQRFGNHALRYAMRNGIRIVSLPLHQSYREASPALARLGVDVDAWPTPPAGLFVVEERTVFLRSATPMTVAHEFGHALDCAIGGGVYRSGYDRELRRAFSAARSFVTPYAASGLDEYFAESLRAFVEVNDDPSPWPEATKLRLAETDPPMYRYLERLMAKLKGDGVSERTR